jgi:hypothetical protein
VINAELLADVQLMIDSISKETGYSLSVGYIDATGRNFAIGSGPRTPEFFEDKVS